MRYLGKILKKYRGFIALTMVIKLLGTFLELLLPYVLEHLIDNVAPTGDRAMVLIWGLAMAVLAVLVRTLNVSSNRMSVRTAREAAREMRTELFHVSLNLSGAQMDEFGLPSITSRMTADSYNVQNFIRAAQTMGVRAPIMMIGGIAITLTMDRGLAMILCFMVPIMIVLVILISKRGIPMFDQVQRGMDDMVRIMRENITGIRVVKALSKEDYENRRFTTSSTAFERLDAKASFIMALPGPMVTLFLNAGLTLVVLIGARRVNGGQTEPGVILAFLTYFNMILMGVMAINRIFMMLSKANASAQRIAKVVELQDDLPVLPEAEGAHTDREGFLVFDHVSFSYEAGNTDASVGAHGFAGAAREQCLKNIDFSVKKGGSLGIIGATGSGKTTIVNLLMRFYDPQEGRVFVDGRDVRTYDRDELRRKFGVVFQNDAIFADTITENIAFGRALGEDELRAASADAMALNFIEGYGDGFEHMADIHGANFSGGQKQRLLISRALAGKPEVLILDDASSALDYRTDASLRKAIREHHSEATTIVVAQRISSIMALDAIIVMDEGEMIGYGTHEQLMERCPVYREIYKVQMGEAA
ncbi:MAG: ABC transporter ATP-binding protein [Clostridia bacterium]|nr:ABC transporter ATP-binding protein [Clostridia bacterium]